MNKEFQKWLNTIPNGKYLETRSRIIKECNINGNIYRNWKIGRTPVPPLAKEKINEIFKSKVFKMK